MQQAADRHGAAAVQLVRNYRSHASLLHLPNRLFYNDTLVAAADQSIVLPPTWAVRQLEGADDEAADESEAWQSEAAAADNEDAEGQACLLLCLSPRRL